MQTKRFYNQGTHVVICSKALHNCKEVMLVVNMFIFKVFVWSNLTCASKKPVDSDSVVLLRRRKMAFFFKDIKNYEKGEYR